MQIRDYINEILAVNNKTTHQHIYIDVLIFQTALREARNAEVKET